MNPISPVIIFLALSITVDATTYTCSRPAETCPDEYVTIGSHCYWITSKEHTWNEGRQYCIDHAPTDRTAGLAHIDDCKELGFVWEYIINCDNPDEDYWIGGSDAGSEGTFRWHSTGHYVPMGTPFWFPGQPDGYNVENALSLSKQGYFADENENIPQRVICQLL